MRSQCFRRSCCALVIIAAMACATINARGALYYGATELGTIPGIGGIGGFGITYASAVNNAGLVAGTFRGSSPGSLSRAFTFDTATRTFTDLGVMPGAGANGATSGRAVNATGHVAGESVGDEEHAYRYSNGTFTDLGTLTPFGPPQFLRGSSRGYGINDAGTVVGQSTNADLTQRHAFVYQNGVMTDLGTLGGDESIAYAINNAGRIVGESKTASGAWHAFLYENGQMKDLGVLAGHLWSTAQGINEAGDIVGGSALRDNSGVLQYRAVLARNGTMIDLGVPTRPDGAPSSQSYAQGINESGVVWGHDKNPQFQGWPDNPFLYKDGTMEAMVVNGWENVRLIGVTDDGRIFAQGVGQFGGPLHILVLHEVPAPEPGAAVPLLAAATWVTWRRWHRRS
jgi:probable HAF family extracellular repeat protein